MWHGVTVLSTALAGFGLTWLVQSSVLLVLGVVAGRVLRGAGPAVQSGIYRTTLAAVLVCPVASVALTALGIGGLSLRLPSPVKAEASSSERTQSEERQPIATAAEPVAPMTAFDLGARSEMPAPALEAKAPIARAAQPKVASTPVITVRPPWQTSVAALALLVWGLGTTVFGFRLWIGQRFMRSLRTSAVPAEPDAEHLCRALATRMNVAPPSVWRSPFLFSPCLDGVRRPAILLPDDVGENLSETFVHELAHLARRDALWNLLRHVAVAVFWVQPFLWVLSRRLESTAEEVCDDYVVQFGADRARYAGHLLDLARRALPPVTPSAVGMVSLRTMLARRVVRILDTSRSLSTRAGKRAVLTMLTVGILGTFGAGLLGVGGGRGAKAQTPEKPLESTDRSNDKDKVISLQVIGPDGKPVPRARVIVSRWRVVPGNGVGDAKDASERIEVVRAAVDENGRYDLALEGLDPRKVDLQVLATAPGFGVGYYLKKQPIRLRAGDTPIQGRVVDLEGRPIAGVKIRLGQILVPAPEVTREPISKDDPRSRNGKLGLEGESLLPDGVTTDADGRFRIEGLGQDVLAQLSLTSPAIAFKKVEVLTRAMDRVAGLAWEPAYAGLHEPGTHGAVCTITVEPTRPIEGIVRDLETKEPIPGAIVTAASLSGSRLMIDGQVSTKTDARGRYRLIGLPKESGQGHELAVYPPLDRPYFMTRHIRVPARPGLDPVPFDFELKRAIWITGKVTDVRTGKPVSASLDYFPFLTNERAKDYPNFDPRITASVGIKTRYKTDREGRFRIPGLPGKGVLTVHTDDKAYLVGVGAETIAGQTDQRQLPTYDHIFSSFYQCLKEIDVPERTDTFTCDLGVDSGGSVRLRLIDESGKRVTGAVIRGRFPAAVDHDDNGLYEESVARVGGLAPGQPRRVLIQHHERKIGALFTIPPDGPHQGEEITVTLHPTATLTGRLVDANGKPAQGGVRIELAVDTTSFFQSFPSENAMLDANGQFRCENLVAGVYCVTATNRPVLGLGPRMEPEAFKPFEIAKDLSLKAGQIAALGTFDVNTAKRIDEPSSAKSGDVTMPINGRIVDLEGQPVAGVLVKYERASAPRSGDLSGWPSRTKRLSSNLAKPPTSAKFGSRRIERCLAS